MKIALLLSCLVAMSYQQMFWNVPYIPFHANDANIFFYDSEVNDQSEAELDTLARTKQLQPQKKFFFPYPFGMFGLFNNQLNVKTATVTTTSTYWTTTSAVATTATVEYCIPLTYFQMSYGPIGTGYYTTPCVRRRRDAALSDEVVQPIEPSETKQVQTTAMAEKRQSDELLSSQDEPEYSTELHRSRRFAINQYISYSTYTVTALSTMTHYNFVPTTLKRTIFASGLACLPPGLAIC